jgi:hypothetical protein
VEFVTTPSMLLLWEAINRLRQDADGSQLPLDELAEAVLAQANQRLSIDQIADAAERLLQLAAHPGRAERRRPVPVAELQVVLEKALDRKDWQELEEDDRDEIQKLIDNATDPDTVLVRDGSRTPELQETGILELLQRYPSRGEGARWSPEDAVAFLETKTRWLDSALEVCQAEGDMVEARSVVLVVPEDPRQALRTEVVAVLIPLEE